MIYCIAKGGQTMHYLSYYISPIGPLMLASNEEAIIGLWLEGQKYFADTLPKEVKEDKNHSVIKQGIEWLDRYFAGEKPDISTLPLSPIGSEFRQKVWKILCEIPYGKVITYGDIAKQMAVQMNKDKMSAQAVGGAVGHNPISIIIPCHRVIGADGNLTGYAGGMDKKIKLLELEGADLTTLYIPKMRTVQ